MDYFALLSANKPSLLIVLGVILIGIDQLSKDMFPGSFLNKGGPLSAPLDNLLILCIGLFLLFFTLSLRGLRAPRYQPLATFILAGGASNLLDRLFFGGVRDPWQVGSLYFNLADLSILIGSVGLMYIAAKKSPVAGK